VDTNSGRSPRRLELLHVAEDPVNDEWKKEWATYAKKTKLANAGKPLTNDPMEAAWIGIHMWKQAVEKAKTTDVDNVIAAMAGQTFKAPSGITSMMDPKNHHLQQGGVHRRSEIRRPVHVVWKTAGPVKAKTLEPVHRRQRQEEDEPDGKTIITK